MKNSKTTSKTPARVASSRNTSMSKANERRSVTPAKTVITASAKKTAVGTKTKSSTSKQSRMSKSIQEKECAYEEIYVEVPRSYTPSLMEFNIKSQLDQSFGLESGNNAAISEDVSRYFVNKGAALFSDQEDEIDQIVTKIRNFLLASHWVLYKFYALSPTDQTRVNSENESNAFSFYKKSEFFDANRRNL